MDNKKILLKDIPKVNPFRVPEGYFENFTNGIMSQLPDVDRKETIKVNLWHRARPWLYIAAMLTGIFLMTKVFVGSPTQSPLKSYTSGGLNLTSSSDIEDYYNFYEDGLAQIAYDDSFYSADFSEDTNLE